MCGRGEQVTCVGGENMLHVWEGEQVMGVGGGNRETEEED